MPICGFLQIANVKISILAIFEVQKLQFWSKFWHSRLCNFVVKMIWVTVIRNLNMTSLTDPLIKRVRVPLIIVKHILLKLQKLVQVSDKNNFCLPLSAYRHACTTNNKSCKLKPARDSMFTTIGQKLRLTSFS